MQPPLSDTHSKLVEAFVNPEDSEVLRPTLEAIKSSEEPARCASLRTAPRSHARESNVTDSDSGSSIW